MQIIYYESVASLKYKTEILETPVILDVLIGSESNWIVPDFVRPIHYSIFEDE